MPLRRKGQFDKFKMPRNHVLKSIAEHKRILPH